MPHTRKKTSQERASQKSAKRLRNSMIKREKRANEAAAKTLRSMKKNGNNAVRTLRSMKNSKYKNNNFKFR